MLDIFLGSKRLKFIKISVVFWDIYNSICNIFYYNYAKSRYNIFFLKQRLNQ